jgi:predicted nucleic acid-binding Zn ribbon protein
MRLRDTREGGVSFHAQPLAGALRRELARLGPAAGIGPVVDAWPEAVGAHIAANAWPARVGRDATLTVAVASSAWAFELTHLEETIRGRLAERLGDATPKRVRFVVGPLPERGAESVPTMSRTAPEPTVGERTKGAEIAAPISDSELRSLVARAAAASLARARSDHSV